MKVGILAMLSEKTTDPASAIFCHVVLLPLATFYSFCYGLLFNVPEASQKTGVTHVATTRLWRLSCPSPSHW